MTHSLITDKHIAIVGGGPGGLTLARLLQRKGATVHVYERDEHDKARTQGGTLDLHTDSGLRALEQAGLLDAFKANYRPSADRLRVVDRQGTIWLDDHADPAKATFGDEHFRPEIDRGPLRDLLLNALQPGTVVWNHPFMSMEPNGAGWRLHFQAGTSVYADLVIAADGGNSRVRPYLTPIQPFYAGITVVEGAIRAAATAAPTINQLLKGGKVFALGKAQTLIVSSKGDGGLAFYTGCKTEASWVRDSGIDFNNRHQVSAWFKTTFADWSPIWWELFDNDSVQFIARPQYCMPLDQTWIAQPNITMLGDAAHLMPPYAGEGVNMAMLDALELSECLTDNTLPDLGTAIAQYEQQMRTRAAAMARMTLDQTESLHAEQGLRNLLRLFGENSLSDSATTVQS